MLKFSKISIIISFFAFISGRVLLFSMESPKNNVVGLSDLDHCVSQVVGLRFFDSYRKTDDVLDLIAGFRDITRLASSCSQMRSNFSGLWDDFFQWSLSFNSDKIGRNLLAVERVLPFNKEIPIRAAFERWCCSEEAQEWRRVSRVACQKLLGNSLELRLSDLQFLSVLDSLKLELALGSLDLLTINKLQTMLSMQCTKVNKSCLVENTRLAELAQNFSRMLHRAGEENVGAKSLSEALQFQDDKALADFKESLKNRSKETSSCLLEQKDFLGMNPLMHAAIYDRSGEWVSFLLDCGANPNRNDIQGMNAFFHACRALNVKSAKLLLNDKKIYLGLIDREWQGFLHYVMYMGEPGTGLLHLLHEKFVNKGMWPDVLKNNSKNEKTPLLLAIKENKEKKMNKL